MQREGVVKVVKVIKHTNEKKMPVTSHDLRVYTEKKTEEAIGPVERPTPLQTLGIVTRKIREHAIIAKWSAEKQPSSPTRRLACT